MRPFPSLFHSSRQCSSSPFSYRKLLGSPAFQLVKVNGRPVDNQKKLPSSPWSVPDVQKCSLPKPVFEFISHNFYGTNTLPFIFTFYFGVTVTKTIPRQNRKKILKFSFRKMNFLATETFYVLLQNIIFLLCFDASQLHTVITTVLSSLVPVCLRIDRLKENRKLW